MFNANRFIWIPFSVWSYGEDKSLFSLCLSFSQNWYIEWMSRRVDVCASIYFVFIQAYSIWVIVFRIYLRQQRWCWWFVCTCVCKVFLQIISNKIGLMDQRFAEEMKEHQKRLYPVSVCVYFVRAFIIRLGCGESIIEWITHWPWGINQYGYVIRLNYIFFFLHIWQTICITFNIRKKKSTHQTVRPNDCDKLVESQ